MKPQDFVKEFNRMCKSNMKNCNGCKFVAMCSCSLLDIRPEEFAKMYDEVAKWSDEHSVKTRQREFLKLFPNAMINESDEILCIPPCHIEDKSIECTNGKSCDDCRREYWLAPIDERGE